MENLKYISFDDDIKMPAEKDRAYIEVKVGRKLFRVSLTENEIDRECKIYKDFSDCHFSTVEAITGLKRIVKFLESSIGIDIPNNLMK